MTMVVGVILVVQEVTILVAILVIIRGGTVVAAIQVLGIGHVAVNVILVRGIGLVVAIGTRDSRFLSGKKYCRANAIFLFNVIKQQLCCKYIFI
jgi:hypothetical protein